MIDAYGAPNDLAAALYSTVLAFAIQHARSQHERESAIYVLDILHSSDRPRPVPVVGSHEPASHDFPRP